MAAPRKKAGTAVATRKASTPAQVKEAIAQQVAQIKDRIGAPETNAISLRDKLFTFPDGQILQDKLRVVIIDFENWNQYYVDKFDPKNPKPPVCFAHSQLKDGMAPSSNSPEPQSEGCDGCAQNEWGSGVGDAKACKNQRKLALMMEGDDPEEGPIYTLVVPPDSIKAFDGYVGAVAKLHNVPPVGVVTTLSFHPDSTYAKLLFTDPVPNPHLGPHFNRQAAARQLLEAEPDTSRYEPASPKKKRAKR